MINSYTNETTWASATKPTNESTVGLLLDKNTPVINGVNVFVPHPQYGDAVLLDENGEIKFIAAETYNNTLIPNTWTRVGVVYWVKGSDVRIVSRYNVGSQKYSDVWRLKVNGYQLDGEDHSGTFNTYSNDGVLSSFEFTYNATTAEEFVSQFNTWIVDKDPNNRGCGMYVDDNGAIQFVEVTYTHWRQQNDSFSNGLSSSPNVVQELPEITWCLDMDGYQRRSNTVNIGSVKRWGGRTLTSVEAVTQNNTPISQASFEGDYGINYRNLYGTYDNYLEHNQVRVPANRGVCSWRDVGKEYTYLLANEIVKSRDGEDIIMYPACNKVANFGYSANSLVAPGEWYISDVEEMVMLMRPITIGNPGVTADQYDRVTKTLVAMGGHTLNTNSRRWCSCRYGSTNMWGYDYGGFLGYYYFVSSYTVVPVVRLFIS